MNTEPTPRRRTRTPRPSPPLQAALLLASIGIPVFPCRASDETINGKLYKAKSPLTLNGFKDATTDSALIESLWRNRPDALIGVPTGKITEFVIIDADPSEHPEAAQWLTENQYRLNCRRIHHTARPGGRHYVYRCPAGADIRCSESVIAPGVDVRAEGGYVIWWPAHGHPVEELP